MVNVCNGNGCKFHLDRHAGLKQLLYIPLLLKASVGLTVKGSIEVTHGGSQEISIKTGRKTGSVNEPYVVAEATTYQQFKYRVVNGPDDGKVFSIDIPQGISPSCYELSYYNSICGADFVITPNHLIGDPESYTTEYSHDTSLETAVEDIGQGVRYLDITVHEEDLTVYTLTAGFDLTAGVEVGGFGFEVTRGVYWGSTHRFTTGVSAHFESQAEGIASPLYDAYRYSYKMYVRRDPDREFPIIDFWVDGSSLGPGYSDTSPPQTAISGGPTGLIDYDDVQFVWTGSDGVTPVSYLEYQYRMDTGSWSEWTSGTSENYNDVSEGQHTFQVRARDLNGNVDPTPASRTFTVDVSVPQVTITSGPSGTIDYNVVTFEWEGSDPPFAASTLTYSYKLEPLSDWSEWENTTDVVYNDLPDDSYTFRVKAKDQVEHISDEAFRTFTVDTGGTNTPPELSNYDGCPDGVDPDSGSPSTIFTFRIHYYDEDGDNPTVKDVVINDVAYAMTGSGSDSDYAYSASGFSLGTHNYYFYFEDGVGGWDRLPGSGQWSFNVEDLNNAPDPPSDPSPADGATDVDPNPTLSVYVSDPDDDALTVGFYAISSEAGTLKVDSESEWQQGGFMDTQTDGSGNLTLAYDTTSVFGDGSDGDLSIPSGVYVLSSDKEYNNVTVASGGILDTHGYTLRVRGTLTNYGIIRDTYSGGTGGPGGAGGRGADPEQNSGGPENPEEGDNGIAGTGNGGDGGGGGGGGGGAWYGLGPVDADGGNGGSGGDGGDGGGSVLIYSLNFDNHGTIHADGEGGGEGENGGDAEYYYWVLKDLVGGGGGGGGGGDGGDGGTVEVHYGNLVGMGTIRADGGAGGGGGLGGDGGCLSYGVVLGNHHDSGGDGGTFDADGGDGGGGEHRNNQCSEDGGNGQSGSSGASGSVSLQSVPIGYAASGQYLASEFYTGGVWTGQGRLWIRQRLPGLLSLLSTRCVTTFGSAIYQHCRIPSA